MRRVINRYAATRAILFTFSVDIVVKKYGITDEQPETPCATPLPRQKTTIIFSLS
jgi:hypothetical protein